MKGFEHAAMVIAAAYAHGHGELVPGCALCEEEWDAVLCALDDYRRCCCGRPAGGCGH